MSPSRNDYTSRLRTIVLQSADVLPREVASYLQRVAGSSRASEAKSQVLKGIALTARSLPKECADFVIRLLLDGESEPDANVDFADSIVRHKLGFKFDLDFFPPAHIQGPFLSLLRSNEEEGLRLVHTLTNVATARWRKDAEASRRGGADDKLLPVVLHLPSGDRNLWGYGIVYGWFRAAGSGPDAVTSALMALEVWAEERIEAGDDPEALFERILAGTDCIAVAGLCVGIALAFPDQCLRAALPLVSAPALWLLDIARYANDASGSALLPFISDREPFVRAALEERATRPQRRTDIRTLALRYLLSDDEDLKDRFKTAVARFTEDLPFLSERTRSDERAVAFLRKEMERFQLFADETLLRKVQTANGVMVTLEPPEEMRKRDEPALAESRERMSWLSAETAIKQVSETAGPVDQAILGSLVTQAKSFQRETDSTTDYDERDTFDATRFRAIVSIASVILTKDFAWAEQQGLIPWCREVLIGAARRPEAHGIFGSREAKFPVHPKAWAARGIGILIEHGQGTAELREVVLELVAHPEFVVAGATLVGLRGLWSADQVLFWNAVSLGLSLCLLPRSAAPRDQGPRRDEKEAKWADELMAQHIDNLRSDIVPRIPSIQPSDDVYFLWDAAPSILEALPYRVLLADPPSKERLFALVSDLLRWTVLENTPDPDDRWSSRHQTDEWNGWLFPWLARLTEWLSVEETRRLIFDPVAASWPEVPHLTAELMAAFCRERLFIVEEPSADAQALWQELSGWLLDDPKIFSRVDHEYIEADLASVVSIIVFVRYGTSQAVDEWLHAPLFAEIIGRWVKLIGHHPYAYRSLLTLLWGPGRRLAPEPAVSWLAECLADRGSDQTPWAEHDNATRTAEFLMRTWTMHESSIRADPDLLQTYGRLVDALIAWGVPLALVLQMRLEGRG